MHHDGYFLTLPVMVMNAPWWKLFIPAVMVTNENKSQPSQWTKHKAKNTRVRPTGFTFKERLPFSAIKRWQASSAICRRANSAASSSFNRTTSWRKLDVLAETAWTCSSKDSSRYRKEANTLSCSLLKSLSFKREPVAKTQSLKT